MMYVGLFLAGFVTPVVIVALLLAFLPGAGIRLPW